MTDTAMISARSDHSSARMAAIAGVVALGLTAAWAVAPAASPAWAHDTLIASTPEEGVVLEESPEEVVLEFSGAGLTVGEAVTNDIRVLDGEGENWATEEPAEVAGSTMRTDLEEDLPTGEYEVVYRVVYSDGHDEESSFSFEVDAPLMEDEDEAAEETETPAPADTPAAETPTEVPTDQDDDAVGDPETEPAVQEGQFPAWAWIAIVAGGLVIILALVLFVWRKLRQADAAE